MRRALALCAALCVALLAACGPSASNDDPRLAQADRAISDGDFVAAQALAEAVLADHAGTGRAELLLGYSLQRRKRYELARPHFERALELEPFEKQVSAHYLLGWCTYNLGELDAARAAFEGHLERAPDYGHSWFGLGLVALDQERLDDAQDAFGRAIELQRAAVEAGDASQVPDLAASYCRRGEVHVRGEEWEAARDDLLAGLRVFPHMPDDWFRLHRVLSELGDDARAADALAQYERLKAAGAPAAGGDVER